MCILKYSKYSASAFKSFLSCENFCEIILCETFTAMEMCQCFDQNLFNFRHNRSEIPAHTSITGFGYIHLYTKHRT